MRQLSHVVHAVHGTHIERRAIPAGACSVLVMAAGFVAMSGSTGVVVASALLTLAVMVGLVGAAFALDNEAGWGVAAVVAAAMPTFLPLYLIGMTIFKRLGAGVAGGLLIGLGGAMAIAAVWYSAKLSRRSTAARPSR
jgi:hypothetical protein